MANAVSTTERLTDDSTVAIIGGGPAGSFLALHLLRRARARQERLRVVLFEHRRPAPRGQSGIACGPYRGCPRCAGGVSPRLSDALAELGIDLPDAVVQSRIQSISVQGSWKPISLRVPGGREMLSVYRGTLPHGHVPAHAAFDAVLIDAAVAEGARLIGSPVKNVLYDRDRYPMLCYDEAGEERTLKADFAAFAGGVNERDHARVGRKTAIDLFRELQPTYMPPRLRKALIIELSAPRDCIELTGGRLHYLEGSVKHLRLDMCSIMPKDGYFTITLIGGSVDDAVSSQDNRSVIRAFLTTPRIRRILPIDADLKIRCVCNPYIVTGTATVPFTHRAAAVGDMAATRLYKDGMLAAHDMARDLAKVIIEQGIDIESIAAGYGPTLGRFRRDNRYASLIFFLYRWFFTSPAWSRIIYQTFASERKSRRRSRRNFERIFWAISSGDENYEQIARAMLRPSTAWTILTSGILVTIRNGLTELAFGLSWADIPRFPTAITIEERCVRREQFLKGESHEFECVYTIHIRATPDDARRVLAALGEPSRPYLRPRWVDIRRVRGTPLQAGCTIRYRIFGGALSFDIVQEDSGDENLIRYRVLNSFANGGSFIFLIEPESVSHCAVTVYLAFNYARGVTTTERILWWAFRTLFPEHIHDVLWNHALCEFKQAAEESRSEPGLREKPARFRQT